MILGRGEGAWALGWMERDDSLPRNYNFAGDLDEIWSRHMVLGPQHAIFDMSDGQLINLSLAFSHLELDPVLVDASNCR